MLRSIPLLVCALGANIAVADSAARSQSAKGALYCSSCEVVEFGFCEFAEGGVTVLAPCLEEGRFSEAQLVEAFNTHATKMGSVLNASAELLAGRSYQRSLSMLSIGMFAYQRFRWGDWVCEKFCGAPVAKESDSGIQAEVIRVVLLVGMLYPMLRLVGGRSRRISPFKGDSDKSSNSAECRTESADRLERWCLLRYFGITLNASAREIRKSYRKKLQSIHPDTNTSAPNHVDAGLQIEQLREAYSRIRTFLEVPVQRRSEYRGKIHEHR